MTSLVIGDSHRLFAEALGALLGRHGYVITATVHTGAETASVACAQRPDLCLVDRYFPDADGLAVVRSIVTASPEVRVMLLTGDAETSSIGRVVDHGAVGYVHKSRGAAVLTESIRRVLAGEIVVDAVCESVVLRRPTALPDAQRLADYLTSRERECLGLLVEGLSTKAMAVRLGVATSTVRTHVQATLTKLGAHSRLETAAIAVRYGLIGDIRADAGKRWARSV
jgi:two-component system nitrate/nitrite response regulator NarL